MNTSAYIMNDDQTGTVLVDLTTLDRSRLELLADEAIVAGDRELFRSIGAVLFAEWTSGWWVVWIGPDPVTRYADEESARAYFDDQVDNWNDTVSLVDPTGTIVEEWGMS